MCNDCWVNFPLNILWSVAPLFPMLFTAPFKLNIYCILFLDLTLKIVKYPVRSTSHGIYDLKILFAEFSNLGFINRNLFKIHYAENSMLRIRPQSQYYTQLLPAYIVKTDEHYKISRIVLCTKFGTHIPVYCCKKYMPLDFFHSVRSCTCKTSRNIQSDNSLYRDFTLDEIKYLI